MFRTALVRSTSVCAVWYVSHIANRGKKSCGTPNVLDSFMKWGPCAAEGRKLDTFKCSGGLRTGIDEEIDEHSIWEQMNACPLFTRTGIDEEIDEHSIWEQMNAFPLFTKYAAGLMKNAHNYGHKSLKTDTTSKCSTRGHLDLGNVILRTSSDGLVVDLLLLPHPLFEAGALG